MPKFWNTPYPFNDFAAISFKRKEIDEYKILAIQQKINENGIRHFENHSYGKVETLIFSSLPPTKIRGNSIFLSGVSQCKGEFVFGQNRVTDNFVDSLGENIGLFTAISIGSREIKITQDYTGSGSLFYAETNQYFVVSNRYHLSLLILSWLGFKGIIDYSKVIASFYARTPFLETNISSKMDIRGTFQLPFHKEIVINRRGPRVSEKESVVTAYNKLTKSQIRELVKLGTKEIVENVSAVIDSDDFEKRVIDLSGGQDSRAVLAALLNVDGAISSTEVYTKDIPNSKDLQIAAGLKNMFGGRFFQEEGRPQHPLTLSENEDIWRSYFMGTYYTMGLGSWSPKGENYKQIRLSGGCGEVYRGLWCPIYKKGIGNPINVNELADKLVGMFSPLAIEGDEEKALLKDLISTELDSIPGMDPLEKFENHYNYFRNRYHYGMRAFEYYHDCSMWYPLLSKSMFRAAMSSNIEERQNKRFMMELTSELHPLLVWVEYDKFSIKDMPELLGLSSWDTRFKNVSLQLDYSLGDWEELQEHNKKTLVKNRYAMGDKFNEEWRNSRETLSKKVMDYYEELKFYYPNIMNGKFYEYLNNNIYNNFRMLHEMYARLSSIKDQIDIFK